MSPVRMSISSPERAKTRRHTSSINPHKESDIGSASSHSKMGFWRIRWKEKATSSTHLLNELDILHSPKLEEEDTKISLHPYMEGIIYELSGTHTLQPFIADLLFHFFYISLFADLPFSSVWLDFDGTIWPSYNSPGP
ncbi:hypothetical protein PanWU01x14_315940 [Parasponia andersonii]|uniref:Uncharacterized protein n=1 Tax=Parasponia andersonii TaxID=3476 RepID=A0A2P5AN47_PARAD|nr:hypothetical protein PanWU01x14_315940 [Parasponia andersonii]